MSSQAQMSMRAYYKKLKLLASLLSGSPKDPPFAQTYTTFVS